MDSRPQTPTAKSREARRKSLRSSGLFRGIGLPQSPKAHYPRDVVPLKRHDNEERLVAIADGFFELAQNMSELSEMHKAVNSFNESFASFMYGLLITMFCNNVPWCPTRAQYEALEAKQREQEKVAELREKLRAARLRNAHLKEQVSQRALESRQKSYSGALFSQRTVVKPRLPPPKEFVPTAAHRKVHVSRDDSFSTTSSFIEVPGSARGATLARTPTNAPNLDQAPRYMRGLFERPGTSNTRRVGAQNVKKTPSAGVTKPPIRVSHSRAELSANPSRIPTASSARTAASGAIQRAQRARDARMSSRPPFR